MIVNIGDDQCLIDGADEYLQLMDVASNTMRSLCNQTQECTYYWLTQILNQMITSSWRVVLHRQTWPVVDCQCYWIALKLMDIEFHVIRNMKAAFGSQWNCLKLVSFLKKSGKVCLGYSTQFMTTLPRTPVGYLKHHSHFDEVPVGLASS